jgi:hypothetical protein
LLAVAQHGAYVLLAVPPCLVAQTAVNLANEGKSIARARKGCIGDEKKQRAVRNNDAIMHQQQLADAAPFEVELGVFRAKPKPTIILDQPNDPVEVQARLDLAELQSAALTHWFSDARPTDNSPSAAQARKVHPRCARRCSGRCALSVELVQSSGGK